MSAAELWNIIYFDGKKETVFASGRADAKSKAGRDVWILRVEPVVSPSMRALWEAFEGKGAP